MPAWLVLEIDTNSSINTREDIPCFTYLISMLIIEEKNMGLDTSSSQSKNNSEQAKIVASLGKIRDKISFMIHDKHTQVVEGQSRGRGSQIGHGRGSKQDFGYSYSIECYNCGERGHISREFPKKKVENKNWKRELNNYVSSNIQIEDKREHLFVM